MLFRSFLLFDLVPLEAAVDDPEPGLRLGRGWNAALLEGGNLLVHFLFIEVGRDTVERDF